MPQFLDACALAKRYLPEYGSKRMKEITGRFDRWGGFVVSGFIEPEVISALARYARDHRVHSADYMRQHPAVVDQFRKELSERAFTVVGVTDQVVEQASDLLRKRPEYAIHAGDAVHLATALGFRTQLNKPDTLVFVTADRGLELAAQAEGLATYNPIREGIGTLRTITWPSRS
ncbi:MAG TPA: type II toxin-antitoxin system VapC family toxin [Longimicrobium sp.]|nr:type II toxin-antitoxin system VapC family toxin [Longimicrobium sp.]